MKKYILTIIIGMMAIVPSNQLIGFPDSQINQADKEAEWKKIRQYWATNLLSGMLIGGATGTAFSCIDKVIGRRIVFEKGSEGPAVLVFLVLLFVEMQVRASLVEEVSYSLDRYAIPNKATLIRNIAWISSWIASIISR